MYFWFDVDAALAPAAVKSDPDIAVTDISMSPPTIVIKVSHIRHQWRLPLHDWSSAHELHTSDGIHLALA